ncbi:MAG: acyl-CoA dehydrogenase N-terminal domain-containing protein [Myxococcales bacterium]|nr:acyl-CoA dehydrogenase N-terminal domain-containing protein [Myxococcales bacterium]
MVHYKSNLRDIQFNLFEYSRTQDVMGRGAFEDMDEETARNVLVRPFVVTRFCSRSFYSESSTPA